MPMSREEQEKWIRHALSHPQTRRVRDWQRHAICPKCVRIAFWDRNDTITCPHCGYSGPRDKSITARQFMEEM